jgi:hypothetical protein
MSDPHTPRKTEYNEQTRGEEITSPTGLGSDQNTLHERAETKKCPHSDEAVESIHNVSISASCDEDEVASSILEDNLRDVEASISEAPYTVFTRSQKRFIAVLAACAGFFSAVSLCAQCTQNTLLTLIGFCKHILSSPQLAD